MRALENKARSASKSADQRSPLALSCLLLLGCGAEGPTDEADGSGGSSAQNPAALVARPDELSEPEYAWELPSGFRQPWEPADNPTTAEKVTLGRHLFYDKRLSGNGTQSCASCHQQALAFTDGRATGLGSTGEAHSRSSMSLANVGYASSLTWGNPLLVHLERQAFVPLFGEFPVEMGLGNQDVLPELLEPDPVYRALFLAAFPDDEEHYTLAQVTKSLGAFQRTLISGRSPFDRFAYAQDEDALTAAEKRGYALFNSEKFECFHCHGGFTFTDHSHYAGKAFFEAPYHNTGLYSLDENGSYPKPNYGVFDVTLKPEHMGLHKAPTLRNIAVTAPYMHDGSLATLDDVLDHYEAGGRTVPDGPNAGVGADNPYKDGLIRPIEMTPDERSDLIAFLHSLTDDAFLNDPAHADPWPEED